MDCDNYKKKEKRKTAIVPWEYQQLSNLYGDF